MGATAPQAAGWSTYFARLDGHLAGGSLSEADAHRLGAAG